MTTCVAPLLLNDRLLGLVEQSHRRVIDIQVCFDQLWRCQRQPLTKADVLEFI
jgi:hypothetical protein